MKETKSDSNMTKFNIEPNSNQSTYNTKID